MVSQSTKVSVQIGQRPQKEYRDLKAYSLDSNILTLADCCSFQIVNAAGAQTGEINLGDPLNVFMSDPRVASGKEIQILKGLVVGVEQESTPDGGTVVNVEGADLGWHLINNCGPLFKNITNITFQKLLDTVIDSSWGFSTPSRLENNTNRRLMQGKAVIRNERVGIATIIPPICFEAGDSIADKLILYARRARFLVNVSSDGYLQIFNPNYGQQGPSQDPNGISGTDFTLHLHGPSEASRKSNNVKRAKVRQQIDGIYTNITCVGTVVNQTIKYSPGDMHPGTFQGRYTKTDVLPFKRLLTFCDSDALTSQPNMAEFRAIQRGERGLFDSWSADYTVEGHVMGSLFITPDAICAVDDSINKIKGKYYISQRRFTRSIGGGTITQITLRKPNLLHGGQ